MKKVLLLSLLFMAMQSRAQFIQQISVIPSNPTTNDQIVVLVDAGFSSGTCEENTQWGGFTASNRYEASTLHCIGMLTYICYDTDSFNLGSLPPGNYRFIVTVDAGGYPSPCTPGIAPGGIDSIDFTVSTATGLSEREKTEIMLTPNPVKEHVLVTGNFEEGKGMFVFNTVEGKEVLRISATSKAIDLSSWASGIYFVRYLSETGLSQAVRLVKD